MIGDGQGGGRYRPVTGWPPVQAVLCSVFILGAAIVVAGIALDMAQMLIPGEIPPVLQQIGSLGILQLCALVLVVVAARRGGERAQEVLGLSARLPGFWEVVRALGGLLAVVVPYTLGVMLLAPESLLADLKPFIVGLATPWWWVVLVVVGIGAPVMEELLFRGFLQGALAKSRLGFLGASVLSTAGWSALHFNYSVAGLIEVFLVGLYFCWLLWRSGSLWLALICHGIYNTVLVLILLTVPIQG